MESAEASSGAVQEKKPNPKNLKDDGTEAPVKKPGSKAQGRKRTKSGCLTCRKRRIKCGEERPTCQNCAKSKRQCEGYNQRVVFKDPLSQFRPPWASTNSVSFASSVAQTARAGDQSSGHATNPPVLAPKPSKSIRPPIKAVDTAQMPSLSHNYSPGNEQRVYTFSAENALSTANMQPSIISPITQAVDKNSESADRSHIPEPNGGHIPQAQPPYYDFEALTQTDSLPPFPLARPGVSPSEWHFSQSSGSQQLSDEIYRDPDRRFPAAAPFHQQFSANTNWDRAAISPNATDRAFPINSTVGDPSPRSVEGENPEWKFQEATHAEYQYGESTSVNPSVSQTKSTQANPPVVRIPQINEDADDPFDVSDDDVTMEEYNETGFWPRDDHDEHLKRNDLGFLVAMQAGQENQGLRMRSTIAWIDRPDMLASYAPSFQSSPLQDSMVARVFCHFVNVTAPIISMYERHPANPSLIFQGQPVPKSQHHIWTYIFPTLAFQNSALLHAILALASLHIAKLQGESITPSLKHYHYSLRRIAKGITRQNKQKHPATLAAAMLLAFYECWCADHQKWSNHLLGAKHLLRQIDFAGMTKQIRSVKKQQRREERERYYQAHQHGSSHVFNEDRSWFQTYVDDVDENLVSMLMGKKLQYDAYGRVIEENESEDEKVEEFTEKDLEIYEIQRDLHWWYCKQDVYQSLLGGGGLFMDYDVWSLCPPRAPIGRLNAIYGTYDHLMLLMGRLADFASKDLRRKRLAIKANGGWRPPSMSPSGAQMPGNPLKGPTVPQSNGPPPSIPNFSGMVPGVEPPKLPMGFEAWKEPSPESTSSENGDLEAQKIEAEEEWQEIRNMFSVLEDHFGDDFQPLGPEFSPPIQTPFGPALQYRTYGIAGIWMNFYMGLIACHRCHPSMPPAAMMAAGIAARQTASFANEMGRIAAGLAPDCGMAASVSPGVGAAIIESTTCLFISAVQYQDAAQRSWTVTRLRDVARLTGWQTAMSIATGCETSWTKQGELGRGPPYTRTTEERVVPNVWIKARAPPRNLYANGEGGRLAVERADRVHYALGILSVQEDFENLDLDNDKKDKS